jgi:hypothetical protein
LKFFPGLLKAIAAVLAPVAAMVVRAVIAYFQGVAPSDVSTGLWVILSGVVVFVLNYLLGKLPPSTA